MAEMSKLPDALEAVIAKFWEDNEELKRQILRDLYSSGHVSLKTTQAGCAAVDIWLSGAKDSRRAHEQ